MIVIFRGKKWRVGDIPVEQLSGRGVKVDVLEQADSDPDYQVVVSDFEAHEQKYGRILENSIVLIHTGQHIYYPNRTRYFGYPMNTPVEANNIKDLHFPGLHPDAAEWLIINR